MTETPQRKQQAQTLFTLLQLRIRLQTFSFAYDTLLAFIHVSFTFDNSLLQWPKCIQGDFWVMFN